MNSKTNPDSTNKGQGMLLPNIPKLTDDKSRMKYMTEYEKYEGELNKHHLGSADATQTMGLKNVSTNFDRRVPSLDEPLDVDLSRNRRQDKKKTKPRVQGTTQVSGARAISSTPPPANTSPAGGSSASASLTQREPNTEVEPSSAPLPPNTALNKSAESATNPAVSKKEKKGKDGTANKKNESENSTSVPMADSTTNHTTAAESSRKGPNMLRSSLNANSRSMDASSPPSQRQLSRSAPPTKKKIDSKNFGGSDKFSASATQTTPSQNAAPTANVASNSLAGTRTATRSEPPPARHNMTGTARALSPTVDPTPTFREAAQTLQFPKSNLSTQAKLKSASGNSDVEDCAELLRLLVSPPFEYADSFLLDMDGIDLSWLAGKRSRPSNLTSLEQISVTGGNIQTIYSPRSALVCLRNGISIKDLRPNSSLDEKLPNETSLREAVREFRMERDKKRRARLLDLLQSDYRKLCSTVDMEALVRAFHNPPPPKPLTEPPTALLQRQERQRRVFETNRMRMEKQIENEKDMHARRLEAEARREQAEWEAAQALEEKKQKEREAKALQEARLEEQKEKNKKMEEFYEQQLREKIAKAEERNQQRLEAQERLAEARQTERKEREEVRQARLARNEAVQREQAEQLMEKRREKEEKLERITQQREERIAQEREEMFRRQEKAQQAREEAQRRAREEEERVREAARLRQVEVEERLKEFQQEREEKRLTHAREEEEKQQMRELARLKAIQQENAFKERTIKAAEDHDAAYAEAQRRRDVEIAISKEREREEIHEKLFAVEKKKRVDEFSKLRTTADLIEKRKAADAVEEQRELIHRKMMEEREALNAEREELKKMIKENKMKL